MSDQAFAALLLHNKTRRQLLDLLHKPAQGLLISGTAGSGKSSLAANLAATLLGISTEKLAGYPYLRKLAKPADKQEISIDEMRQLNNFLSLKIPGTTKNKISRIVLIEDANFLSREAQNALLKMLEEPPAATAFILTAPGSRDLLPTVASRLQTIAVVPVGAADAAAYFGNDYKPAAIQSAWRLSGGAPGLLASLLIEATDHPLKQAVSTAKEILSGNAYQRLLIFNSFANDRAQFQLILDALARTLAVLSQTAIVQQTGSRSAKILASRRLVANAMEALAQNVSPRLISLKLALNLSI